MDSARCALRLGAEKVYIVYRRGLEELPARQEEVENAREEGVIFELLTNPLRFIGDSRGYLKKMECVKMQLGDLIRRGPDDAC
jgi:glutamate synthase (NADPH/NADH) small chain